MDGKVREDMWSIPAQRGKGREVLRWDPVWRLFEEGKGTDACVVYGN